MTLDIVALLVLVLGVVLLATDGRARLPGLIAFGVGLLVLVAHAGWAIRI